MRRFSGHVSIGVSIGLLALLGLLSAGQGRAAPAHGFSPIHELKYARGFQHFDYVNPSAPKGGVVRLATVGTFDSLNTLHYPGTTPEQLRTFLYDRLMVASADEPAAYYGLLARAVDVADDLSWARFHLRADARWHDGQPITADDLVFTFRTLAKQGAPYYRQVLRLFNVEKEGRLTVLFRSERPGDRAFVRIVGTLPVHPRHFWQNRVADGKSLTVPLGSGPYRVERAEAGRRLVLERVTDYWAKDHPVNLGRFNFDRIKVDYYRDKTVALEAFTAGEFDLWQERDAASWSTRFQRRERGSRRLVQHIFALDTPGRSSLLVFNLRRPLFQDLRVRRAIALAYDFEWTNRTIFHGLYKPIESFYGDTALGASGPMTGAEERVLGDAMGLLPNEAIDDPGPRLRDGAVGNRQAFRAAGALLTEAGYPVVDGVRRHRDTGERLEISVAFNNPALVRVLGPFARNLERLGVALSYPLLEPTSAVRKLLDHDFDMAYLAWQPRMLPGNAERLLWGSALARSKGTYALAGAQDPALDAAISAMLKARTWADLKAATQAFDRTLRWRRYTLPLWRTNEIWLAHWDGFGRPDRPPSISPSFVDRWWSKGLTLN